MPEEFFGLCNIILGRDLYAPLPEKNELLSPEEEKRFRNFIDKEIEDIQKEQR